MIRFTTDPVLQAQYERLRAGTCPGTSHGFHCLRSVSVPRGWLGRFLPRRRWPIHWRCQHCNLDEPRVSSGVVAADRTEHTCRTECRGCCTYPRCIG